MLITSIHKKLLVNVLKIPITPGGPSPPGRAVLIVLFSNVRFVLRDFPVTLQSQSSHTEGHFDPLFCSSAVLAFPLTGRKPGGVGVPVGEHYVDIVGVGSSILPAPTIKINDLAGFGCSLIFRLSQIVTRRIENGIDTKTKKQLSSPNKGRRLSPL